MKSMICVYNIYIGQYDVPITLEHIYAGFKDNCIADALGKEMCIYRLYWHNHR